MMMTGWCAPRAIYLHRILLVTSAHLHRLFLVASCAHLGPIHLYIYITFCSLPIVRARALHIYIAFCSLPVVRTRALYIYIVHAPPYISISHLACCRRQLVIRIQFLTLSGRSPLSWHAQMQANIMIIGRSCAPRLIYLLFYLSSIIYLLLLCLPKSQNRSYCTLLLFGALIISG